MGPINQSTADSAICSSFLCSFQFFSPLPVPRKLLPKLTLLLSSVSVTLPDFSTFILLILALLLLFTTLHYPGRPLSLVSVVLLSALTPFILLHASVLSFYTMDCI